MYYIFNGVLENVRETALKDPVPNKCYEYSLICDFVGLSFKKFVYSYLKQQIKYPMLFFNKNVITQKEKS
jgi:hypothetical protein